MSDSNSAIYTDIKRKGSDFTFTGKLAEYAKNDEWVESYKSAIGEESSNDSLLHLWKTVKVGSEETGNKIYEAIKNYVNDIGNIDACGVDRLKEYGNILGITSEYLNTNIRFPIEIQTLVDIFSVNRAYLYNKATDGSADTLVLSNTILHSSTVEKFLESLNDAEKYKKLIHDCIYNTIVEFINLKNVTFDDSNNGVEEKEIWKSDINRFTNKLWSDDVESDDDVFELKKSLSVDKSFTEKIYADDIIAGIRDINEFSDSEQVVLNREIERRQTRYSDANSMKYYYVRLYKVLEYFRFCATVYSSVYELETYDLNDNKYTIKSTSDDNSVLKYNYDSYEINTSLIRKVTEWITDYIINVSKLRTTMRSQCQRNTMTGTKRLLIDLIRKFILDNISDDIWNTMKNSVLKNSYLNKNFDVDVIQYVDTTDYMNVENKNDSITPSEYMLRPRFWENYNDLNNAISNDEILEFFNRISDDGYKFKYNRDDGKSSDVNLFEFLSILFETGATCNTNSDYNLSSEVYTVVNGSEITSESVDTLSDDAKNVILKYSGDENIGSAPYANEKNTFHPSYQVIPFIQAFEEYNETYSSIVNLVSSYTENIKDSVSKLSKRLDRLGNTINFWYRWNDDFSGYTTTREKVDSNDGTNGFSDSPFNFHALNSFLNFKDEYISNLLEKNSEYYINSSTGSFVLDDDEINLESARLQKYYSKIKMNANREIYKYGKDYNGNIFILYKDDGNRNNRNSLGDIWVRLRNHPIAFPLFDITMNPSGFSNISTLSESDNSKLMDVLSKIISRFEETYGKHYTEQDNSDGSVVPLNIGVSYGSYSSTLPVTSSSKSVSSEPLFNYEYSDFNIDTNPKLTLVSTTDGAMLNIFNAMDFKTVYSVDDISSMSGYKTTEYYVDNITNSVVEPSTISRFKVYSEDSSHTLTEVPNLIGKIIDIPSERYFAAEYDKDDKTFVMYGENSTINKDLVFSEFTDEVVYDDDITYYCKDSSSEYGEMHPCTKRILKISKLFKLEADSLSGYVDDDGNVHFGGDIDYGEKYDNNTKYSSYEKSIETVASSSVVDGGLVKENFDAYTYGIKKGESGESETVDYSTIVFLGGSNPYHVYYDEDGKMCLKSAVIQDTQISEYDAYDFGDNIYRTYVRSEFISSYPISDCSMSEVNGDAYGRFTLKSNPYKYYHPYTYIYGEPFENENGGTEGLPKGHINITGKDGTVHTFYYNLSSWDLNGVPQNVLVKSLKYNRYFSTINITSSKFNGKFELTPENSSEYPIYLTFDDGGADNVATYYSYSTHQDHCKFFDMGFSYNQKMFYMTYYNDSNRYLDSGTIIGRFNETYDGNYNTKLTFFRDSSHNLEYIDPSSMSVTDNATNTHVFHIGDCSSKKGIISAYARKYNPKNNNDETEYLEIQLTFINENNVFKHKFNIPLRYCLYEFDDSDDIYSFKLSCTVDRAYVSFVTKTPNDDDILCNTIDESSIGKLGSTTFGDIKDKCGDSTITILSFDISDIDNVVYKEDETRYLMQSGSIGYFSQFSGMNGKNNVFSNSALSADSDFSFELMTKNLESDSSNIKFYSELTSDISTNSSGEKSESIGRFINIYADESSSTSDTDSITGIAISDSNEYAYAMIASENGGKSVKFTNYDGKKIYDVSRGIGNGLMFFADGDDSDTRAGAFILSSAESLSGTFAKNYADVNGLKMIKVPIQTSLSGYYSTDFIELEDSDENVYAFCSDGSTVVKTSVVNRGNEFIPTSGIVRFEFNPNGVVNTYDELCEITNCPEETIYKVIKPNDNPYYPANSMFKFKNDEWKYIISENVAENETISKYSLDKNIQQCGYEDSSTNGNADAFAERNGSYITIFGAYGNNSNNIIIRSNTIKRSYTYEPIPFFVGNVPYLFEFKDIIDENEIQTVVYNVKVVENDGSVVQVTTTDEYGETVDHTLMFDYTDPIIGIVNTQDDDVKMIYTERGGIYKYTLACNDVELSHTFDNLKNDIEISDYDMNVIMCESGEHIVISYYVEDLSKGGLLYTKKNVPDSAADCSIIKDINGKNAASVKISKILSIKETVLFKDDESGLIFISEDDGITFNVLSESTKNEMNLIGCGANKFYARYSNNEKASSYDGYVWNNVIGVPFSNWNVFNANGIDYIACDEYDSDLESKIVDISQYINIDAQATLDGKYDGIRVKDGIVVCFGGIDGTTPIKISRANGIDGEFETFEFSYSRNFTYNRVERSGNDLIFPPDGGNLVLIVKDAFNLNSEPYIKYVDISNTVNNTINAFGGMETVCGRLIMCPSVGDRIIAYNENLENFYNLYSFGKTVYFSDIDSIDGTENSEAIIIPKFIDSDGKLRFFKTNFKNQSNYGIVEIDDGFPILVTYGKYNTEFRYNGTEYEMYSFTFTFLNDRNHKSVTIISIPELDDEESEESREIIKEESSKSSLYVSGNESICYNFSSIGNSPRYHIKKIFKKSGSTKETVDYLTVSYSLQSIDDRNDVNMDYELADGTDGAVSVYKNFTNSQYTIHLKDIDTSSQTTFKIKISEEDLVDGKAEFRMRVSFSVNADDEKCTIYWGDGEIYDTVVSSATESEVDGKIVKDGNIHTYVHSYYSTGEMIISIGDGLTTFMCGVDDDSDKSKEFVIENINFSNSQYFTSASQTFKDCVNLTGTIPNWGSHITNAHQTYSGCYKLSSSIIPNWNDSMTDISECYDGCKTIGN